MTYGFVGEVLKLPYTTVKKGDTLAMMEEGAIYLVVKRDGVNLDASLLPTYLLAIKGRKRINEVQASSCASAVFSLSGRVGGLSMYVLIFVSLLVHEVGHLLAAYLTGMRVRSCTIMPYGGELVIANRIWHRKKRIFCTWGTVGNRRTTSDCDMHSVSG